MYYLITEDQLRKIAKGRLSLKNILVPANIAICTASGEDVIEELRNEDITLDESDLVALIDRVSDEDGQSSDWRCYLEEEIEQIKQEIEEERIRREDYNNSRSC
jgi:hypothetical protein